MGETRSEVETPRDQAEAPDGATGEAGEPVLRSAEVGARISELLNAAEEAAEQIRAEARRDAAALLRDAEQRARARVEELTGEPERLRTEAQAEAENVRRSAHDEAARLTTEAAAAAEKARTEAERAAAETRQRAEHEARDVEARARRRERELRQHLRAIEEGKQRALHGVQGSVNDLRTVLTDLEGVVRSIGDVSTDGGSQARPSGSWRSVFRSRGTPGDGGPAGGPGEDVYEVLQDAVEKVGDRWVPKEEQPAAEAPAEERKRRRKGA